jgi:dienelactone hydrolase
MPNEIVTYQGSGLTLKSELFLPAGGTAKRIGVLVFPEAFGLNDNAREKAERLAGLGYVTLACDIHGQGELIDDLEQALKRLQPLYDSAEHMRGVGLGALQALAARPEVDPARIAAIGFCFGGTMSLELARDGAPIKAAVGFHSGLKTKAPAKPGAVKARVLALIGADDPFIPQQDRSNFEAEMRASGADWQIHYYGRTVHSFTSRNAAKRQMPEAIRYDAAADARSWASMLALFDEVFASA